ncbi:MAG: hypothetical protein JZU50_00735 [Desulfobulbaceae bacterium]|nr:hypothetical protein [Desulfobulbaceae bacterium]
MLASGKGDKNIKTNPTSCGFKEKRGGTTYAFSKWWSTVTRKTVKDDLIARIVGAIVALPQDRSLSWHAPVALATILFALTEAVQSLNPSLIVPD